MTEEGRWETYVLLRGEELQRYWTTRFSNGAQVALLLGRGFDPRMCLGIELLRAAGGDGAMLVFPIDFHLEGTTGDELTQRLAEENEKRFTEHVAESTAESIDLADPGESSLARRAARAVPNLERFSATTDIVVDINALPRPVFFPLITKLLKLVEAAGDSPPNLHIFAGDSAWLDALIVAEGVDETASFLFPYSGAFSVEATAHLPRVWMPVLGEGTAAQLQRISDLVGADEICPVLPFPASDPRRGDKLFEEYRPILFDQLRADSGAIIFAAESNPFQVYRQIRQSAIEYSRALQPLGGCKTAFSVLASKLASIGVLLVAYELADVVENVGVADIGAQGHRLQRPVSLDEAAERTELVGATVAGESYRGAGS
jgi:hypothetical protein